jgi:hypothetical protein
MKKDKGLQRNVLSKTLQGGLLAWVMILALTAGALRLQAQQITGTLSGTAYDQAGAAIPNAQIVLKNESSGDERTLTSEADGHFVITALQPATYSITITAKGFAGFQENGIVMNQGDHKEIPNIKLAVGTAESKVDVVSGVDAVVPTDTGEISTVLNQQMIEDFPLQGRDAGELLKIVPGMALNNGASQGSSFNDQKVGSNNGPVGAYSSNGTQPNGTMAYMLDGANLVDPGNDGTQIANINPDMVGNIKILTGSYGAEYAKGPVIFQALSRSGGARFHGEAYLYTHNAVLNSVDAYTKSQGGTNAGQSYYYLGGNVGGPIVIPRLGYTKNRDKLFFWAGYEYMIQHPAGSITNNNVPNAAQLSGDFSNTGIPAQAITTWPRFYTTPSANLPAGWNPANDTFPTADIDPNIVGMLKLYPGTTHTPSAANGWTNYSYSSLLPQNRWEATGKVDYAISDNDKVTVSYAYQKEADLAPVSIWWAEPSTLPYASPGASQTTTWVNNSNYTHVFNSTTTNEVVFSESHFQNPYKLSDPAKATRAANNFNVPTLYKNSTSTQIPNLDPDYCCSGQLGSINYYPLPNGSFGGIKEVPAIYDNFTKLLGKHTVKAGFYWDQQANSQPSTNPSNGTYNIETYGQTSTQNLVADLMLGDIQSYNEYNTAPIEAIKWHQWSIYGQDSYKATRKLTLNFGLRLDHIGQWYGTDFQVLNLATYVDNLNASAAPANTGLEWHANNPSVPVSGFSSRLFNYAPRLGVAYDLFGTGKTVLRAGYGTYYYQASTEVGSAATGPLGQVGYTTPNAFVGYSTISTFTPTSATEQNGSYNNVYGMQLGDSRVPFTTNWNLTVSQALRWHSVAEVSYVGNRSANEYMDGSNSNLYNLNNVAPGGLFQKDPYTGRYVSSSAPSCQAGANESLYCVADPLDYNANYNANDFRPHHVYQNMYLLTHAPYSRYNALQATFQKQSGPITVIANYTFSKVLGIRDGGSNNGDGNGSGVDPFVLRNNYGPLAYDHTNILNFTYNYRTPSFFHGDGFGMAMLRGAVNGWQLSGYTAYQSGAPLQVNTGGNFNASYPTGLSVPTVGNPNLPDNSIALPNGLRSTSVTPSTWFGSNAYNVIVPTTTCNPGAHLSKGQLFNPACFTTPAYGTQGSYNRYYLREPHYIDSDLGIYKSFKVHEAQRVEIQARATNWLNHPLPQFGLAGNSDISLNFQQTVNGVTSLSPTNTNTTTTGIPAFKTGSRFVTLAAKYFF